MKRQLPMNPVTMSAIRAPSRRLVEEDVIDRVAIRLTRLTRHVQASLMSKRMVAGTDPSSSALRGSAEPGRHASDRGSGILPLTGDDRPPRRETYRCSSPSPLRLRPAAPQRAARAPDCPSRPLGTRPARLPAPADRSWSSRLDPRARSLDPPRDPVAAGDPHPLVPPSHQLATIRQQEGLQGADHV